MWCVCVGVCVCACVWSDFMEKELRLPGGGGEVVRLLLWDTAGQEMFARLTRSYYRGAGAVLFVFSTTDRASFLELPRWREKVREEVGDDVVAALVQNKVDLIEQAAVTAAEAEDMARRLQLRLYRVCVKDNVYVEQVFTDLARSYIDGGGGAAGGGVTDAGVAQISELTAKPHSSAAAQHAHSNAGEDDRRTPVQQQPGAEGKDGQAGGELQVGEAAGGESGGEGADGASSAAAGGAAAAREAVEEEDGADAGKRRRKPQRGDERVAGAFQLTPLTVRTRGKKSGALQQLCSIL